MYVPVVTLSTENGNKFLEQLISVFKRTIKWNKCRSEMTNQTKTNNLNYLIDTTFNKVNRYLSYHLKMKMAELFIKVLYKDFLMCQWKAKKKHTKKLLGLVKWMITQLVI